jgi:hypothetical protein
LHRKPQLPDERAVDKRSPAGWRGSLHSQQSSGLAILIPLATLLALLPGLLLAWLLLATTLLLLATLTRFRVVLLLLVRVLVLLVHRELLGDLPPTMDNVPRKEFVPVASKRPR